jgi:hypothetical protein
MHIHVCVYNRVGAYEVVGKRTYPAHIVKLYIHTIPVTCSHYYIATLRNGGGNDPVCVYVMYLNHYNPSPPRIYIYLWHIIIYTYLTPQLQLQHSISIYILYMILRATHPSKSTNLYIYILRYVVVIKPAHYHQAHCRIFQHTILLLLLWLRRLTRILNSLQHRGRVYFGIGNIIMTCTTCLCGTPLSVCVGLEIRDRGICELRLAVGFSQS